ncbi:MAG: hypothetical protein JO093_22955 [Acidobacteria bacterium]|nr:hypothetical protein [Acidobacteriota bacterium]MBV9070615.1 hypothetical protein [Acidobacteriota bacterium]MBV9188487.1 hypothetical protein [Acidobacteriota bacterium]
MKRMITVFSVTLVITAAAYAQDEMKAKAEAQRGAIGAAVGKERHSVGGGRVREFEKGAIYWSSATGARVVKGDTLKKYQAIGAETGSLGYPVGDERPARDGLSQTFEHGFLRTTATGDVQTEILSGVTLTENSLMISNTSGIRLGIDDGFLTIRDAAAPQTTLTCSCELNPEPFSQRLGFCTVSISKDRKRASCRAQDCNGSCVFEKSSQ